VLFCFHILLVHWRLPSLQAAALQLRGGPLLLPPGVLFCLHILLVLLH
jgi:hypothetical protein